jgi:hypothetical protein
MSEVVMLGSINRCDFPSANQLVGILSRYLCRGPGKIFHTSHVSGRCCLILPDSQGQNHTEFCLANSSSESPNTMVLIKEALSSPHV